MSHFQNNTNNMIHPHKGIFWLIEDWLLTFPFEKDKFQTAVAKSGDTYVHKYLWKEISKSKIPYNFYPRGRVEINKCEQAIVYMNPNIVPDYVGQIIKNFGLREYPRIIYDNSIHYRCYLDEGWKAD